MNAVAKCLPSRFPQLRFCVDILSPGPQGLSYDPGWANHVPYFPNHCDWTRGWHVTQTEPISVLPCFFKETYLEKIDFFFLLWVSSWRYESGDCPSIFACHRLLQVKLALALQNGYFLHNFTWMLQNLPAGYEAYITWKKVGHPGSTILEALLQDSVLLLLRAETLLRTGCQSLSTQFCFLQWSFTSSPLLSGPT